MSLQMITLLIVFSHSASVLLFTASSHVLVAPLVLYATLFYATAAGECDQV